MNTAILPAYFVPIARREQLAARAAARRIAPARFCGIQEGFGSIPAIELWNLTADIPGHCAGSTVARETLLAAGYILPPRP